MVKRGQAWSSVVLDVCVYEEECVGTRTFHPRFNGIRHYINSNNITSKAIDLMVWQLHLSDTISNSINCCIAAAASSESESSKIKTTATNTNPPRHVGSPYT